MESRAMSKTIISEAENRFRSVRALSEHEHRIVREIGLRCAGCVRIGSGSDWLEEVDPVLPDQIDLCLREFLRQQFIRAPSQPLV